MELIRHFIDTTPGVDPNRVYIGGCSNGGFAVQRAMFLGPELFAAAWPICPVYHDIWVTEEKMESIAHIPTWLVHDINDPTVVYAHSQNFYDAMLAVGAPNVHITLTDGLYDTTGQFFDEDGNPHRFNDHWSWIPVLNNEITDPRGTSIFAWMAEQTLEGAPAEPEPVDDVITPARIQVGSTTITVAGETQIVDAAPFMADGHRVMVSIYTAAALFGLDVYTLSLPAGVALPGGLGTPVEVEGIFFVPLRYVAMQFDATVAWNATAQAVYIS